MIDLLSLTLPGIDDSAPDPMKSRFMARAGVVDGVSVVASTKHILPGLIRSTGSQIRGAAGRLQQHLEDEAIPLSLVTGADNHHVILNFAAESNCGRLLSLTDTRYVTVEPAHHTASPRLGDLFFSILKAGYRTILTHPERLIWIKLHYDLILILAPPGGGMRTTAKSLTNTFGRGLKYWGERILNVGIAPIPATNSHDLNRRPPILTLG